ncbi:vacuolar segregation subunit 7-domain-containing protein, partial [Lipomyces japonicus]|uniref:vacuolar segregation subunit 7-domain-containing protein n=1 Tax=Lipomyces japonicus TaxID=56871 RepID=UPI0034CFED75
MPSNPVLHETGADISAQLDPLQSAPADQSRLALPPASSSSSTSRSPIRLLTSSDESANDATIRRSSPVRQPGMGRRSNTASSTIGRFSNIGGQESDSDGGYKSDDRPASVRKLFHNVVSGSTGTGSGGGGGSLKRLHQDPKASSKAMTVETETVTTVPSVTVSASAQGSVKSAKNPTKASIKHKKKKPRPLPSFHGSSRADIFAAKIASAVGDHDSSDSDETFVYESNPRDANKHLGVGRGRQRSSRSPSITSSFSTGGGELPDLSVNGYRALRSDPRFNAAAAITSTPNLYGSNKVAASFGLPPNSPRFSVRRGAAGSAIGVDIYGQDGYYDNDIDVDDDDDDDDDDEDVDNEVDIDNERYGQGDIENYDERTPLNASLRRRRRRRARRIARKEISRLRLRRSLLIIGVVFLALLLGFSLGVIYVT